MTYALRIGDLSPGTRFVVSGMPDLVGVLVYATPARARVRLDVPPAAGRNYGRDLRAIRQHPATIDLLLAVVTEAAASGTVSRHLSRRRSPGGRPVRP